MATFAHAETVIAPKINETEVENYRTLQTTSYQNIPTPQELKEFLYEEVVKYGNPKDYFTLENVIQCESEWNADAHNPKSTASGVAEFLDGTWNDYCGGDKSNPYDQIRCLVIEFPLHPSWWSESASCWSRYITN